MLARRLHVVVLCAELLHQIGLGRRSKHEHHESYKIILLNINIADKYVYEHVRSYLRIFQNQTLCLVSSVVAKKKRTRCYTYLFRWYHYLMSKYDTFFVFLGLIFSLFNYLRILANRTPVYCSINKKHCIRVHHMFWVFKLGGRAIIYCAPAANNN